MSGDFNAEPTEPVYNTILGHNSLGLSSAYSELSCADRMKDMKVFQTIIYNNESIKDTMTTSNENNKEIVKSIGDISAAREPLYTTWKIREDGEVCHTIDYVFYSKNKLKVRVN